MALELVKLDSETLPGIADAIRSKTGETALLLPSEMAAAIAGIPTGGSLPALTKPAAESDVLAGKEYIDGNGNKKTGTLVVADSLFVNEVFLEDIGVGAAVNVESSVDGSTKDLTLPEPNLMPENIKSGVMIYGCTGNAKILRVETGTITPAEDVIDLTIPAPFDGYCALLLSAADRTALEQKGADSIHSVRVMHALYDGAGQIGVMNRYNGTGYSAATKTPIASDDGNIYLSGNSGRYFRAGIVYNYYVYYWEDT